MSRYPKSPICCALLAGALGLAASSASAQAVYRRYDDPAFQPAPPESVEVGGQRFRAEMARMGQGLERVSLTDYVSYSDLNLRTRHGASELRGRVRAKAQDVCDRLAAAYPVYETTGTSCLKTALDDALLRADAAIRGARDSYRS
jgi:UrcA family protein